MTTDKEELRKEYFKMLGMAAPIAERENPELFDWFYSKLEAKDKEIEEVDEQLQLYHQLITDLKAEKLKADQDIIDLQRLLADRARDLENAKAEIERLKHEIDLINE